MTLDELIAEAIELRDRFGGDTQVKMSDSFDGDAVPVDRLVIRNDASRYVEVLP